jgi:glutaconyl-CoA/methylmalonyl-CoA decarboxylase subunit gamma
MIRQFKVKVNKKDYHVEVEEVVNEIAVSSVVSSAKKKMENSVTKESFSGRRNKPAITFAAGTKCEIKAPLPGVIGDILVKEGKTVHTGDKVLVLEAMKMENAILAPATGKVESIAVNTGDSVLGAQLLLTIVC